MTDVTAPGALRLRAAFRSDRGRLRTNNEDLPLVDAERGVYGVIDGVGGQAAGELAAAIACDVILQRLARPLGTPAERVREAIAIANNEIFRRAAASPDLQGMTCVVTLAVIADRRLTIGHVGDSRLYKLRADGIVKLTRDHSPVGEREDARQITEAEAMRHPRRHEVFRDVGGCHRDKDEEEYVDVIEEPMEPDSAILLCTDGLSDMVPAAAIDRIVKQHAGDVEAVVDALIRAANDAGGKDNITVVYVEGPDFPRGVGRSRSENPGQRPALPESLRAVAPANPVLRLGRWILHSRTTWFALGVLAGLLAALLLVSRVPATNAVASRTIVVGATGPGSFSRIGDALREARPGDTVRVEPGLYPERLLLPDGVSLIARVPSSVTLARAAGVPGEWIALTATGELGGRISGIRIESTAELAIDVGIRVAGQGRTIELLDVAGPMRVGLEVLAGTALTLHGGQFAVLQGTALKAGEWSQAVVTRNVFLRGGQPFVPPVSVGPMAKTTLKGNLFVGFGPEIVKGASPADRQQIAAANVIVTAEPSRVR